MDRSKSGPVGLGPQPAAMLYGPVTWLAILLLVYGLQRAFQFRRKPILRTAHDIVRILYLVTASWFATHSEQEEEGQREDRPQRPRRMNPRILSSLLVLCIALCLTSLFWSPQSHPRRQDGIGSALAAAAEDTTINQTRAFSIALQGVDITLQYCIDVRLQRPGTSGGQFARMAITDRRCVVEERERTTVQFDDHLKYGDRSNFYARVLDDDDNDTASRRQQQRKQLHQLPLLVFADANGTRHYRLHVEGGPTIVKESDLLATLDAWQKEMARLGKSEFCMCAPFFGITDDLIFHYHTSFDEWIIMLSPRLIYENRASSEVRTRVGYDERLGWFPYEQNRQLTLSLETLFQRDASAIHHDIIDIEYISPRTVNNDRLLSIDNLWYENRLLDRQEGEKEKKKDRRVSEMLVLSPQKDVDRERRTLSGTESACYFHCRLLQQPFLDAFTRQRN